MAKFTLNQLTEGIRQRHMGSQYRQLTEKWNRTGLLRGLEGQNRENMAVMLENQAAQLLREANSLSTGGGSGAASGDIRGFQNIAFPIVRRVFGGLVANDLVSIQPMSLPSGLLFYLDYTYGTETGGYAAGDSTYKAGDSIYNGPAGKGVRSGSLGIGGQYDLAGSGYSRVHATTAYSSTTTAGNLNAVVGSFNNDGGWTTGSYVPASQALTGTVGRLLQFDPQLNTLCTEGDDTLQFVIVPQGDVSGSSSNITADLTMIKDIGLFAGSGTFGDLGTVTAPNSAALAIQGGADCANIRRLNQRGDFDATATPAWTADPVNGSHVLMVVIKAGGTATVIAGVREKSALSFVQNARLDVDSSVGDALTVPSFESDFGTGATSPVIPEIDIKIESISVTAVTRKLRARWSPELAQDLNAYHSLDAEVELTQILSEQIALELDREILNDLLTQANGAAYYWSRAPGKFVNKETGAEVSRTDSLRPGPAFTGTVREWYETLSETIIDVANTIHRKTLRGSANFIVVGPDVATILESSVLYKPVYSLDGDGQVGAPMTIGAEKVGNLSNRFTVYKDPYFPRNKILVGYKGGSYLETGYVYAPYVPLIVTPTIFAPEDFTPRKGVMTRYGKKMVRSDFYGTVTCMDMHII
jgi:hypothetical protein